MLNRKNFPQYHILDLEFYLTVFVFTMIFVILVVFNRNIFASEKHRIHRPRPQIKDKIRDINGDYFPMIA